MEKGGKLICVVVCCITIEPGLRLLPVTAASVFHLCSLWSRDIQLFYFSLSLHLASDMSTTTNAGAKRVHTTRQGWACWRQ